MESNSGKAFMALVVGAAIGAGIGILFAPDKGTNTRGKLKTGFDDKKNELKDKYEDLSEKLKSKFAQSKVDLEETFDDLVANVDERTGDVIASLERKLDELKQAAAGFKDKK